MTREEARAVARTMTLTAGVVAGMLVVGLPAAYLAVAYQYALGAADTQAEVSAREAARLVFANPRMWSFEVVRLTELMERRSESLVAESRRILDASGRVVAESADSLQPPVFTSRHTIQDALGPVAVVEVSRSLRPVLLETAAVLVGALTLATAVFVGLRILPLRVVRRAYQSLVDSEKKYRSIFEAMREGLAMYRVVEAVPGRTSLQLVDVNPAGAKLLELGDGREPGGGLSPRLEDALGQAVPRLPEATRTGDPCTFDLALPERSRFLRVSVFSTGPGLLAAFFEDVTERRLLQEQLAHADKLQAVGRLAGGVAHDFNNILTVILSFAGELADALSGEQLEHAREIEKAGQRAAALTRQLLAFSRRQVFHPEVLVVGTVVEGVASMIRRLLGADVALEVEVAEGTGAIHMDPSQFEQVLVNLAVNARDAMPGGGRLTIRARPELPGDGEDGAAGYVLLTVTDTGTGMDEAVRQRIFEPFFTTKPAGKGTGLGLATVFGAVEQVGGSIQVESARDKGTTFSIRLPRLEPAAAPAAAERGDGPRPGRSGRVLLVDDEPQLRAAVSLFLGAGGYAVTEAPGGSEALGLFQANPQAFDLVLTDVAMPGMGGLALGRSLEALRPVPVLYMSGFSEELAPGGETLPPGSFLRKPFDRATLLRRVEEALDRRAGGHSPLAA